MQYITSLCTVWSPSFWFLPTLFDFFCGVVCWSQVSVHAKPLLYLWVAPPTPSFLLAELFWKNLTEIFMKRHVTMAIVILNMIHFIWKLRRNIFMCEFFGIGGQYLFQIIPFFIAQFLHFSHSDNFS